MNSDLSNYEIEQFRTFPEKARIGLVKDLMLSDSASKLALLKTLYTEEISVPVKYEIRRAIDELESLQKTSETKPCAIGVDPNIEKLNTALESEDQDVRNRALSFLVKNRRTDFLKTTLELEKRIQDPYLQAANLKLLAVHPSKNLKSILTYLNSTDSRVIAAAVEILGVIGSTQTLAFVIQYLNYDDNRVRANAAAAVAKIDQNQAEAVFEKMVQSEYPAYRNSAAYGLGLVHLPGAQRLLQMLLEDESHAIRAQAQKSLLKLSGSHPVAEESPKKPSALSSDYPNIREQAIASESAQSIINDLGEIGKLLEVENDPRLIATLIMKVQSAKGDAKEKIQLIEPYLESKDDRIRANAVEILAKNYPEDQTDFFLRHLEDESNRVVGNAIVAICKDGKCPEKYRGKVKSALRKLASSDDQHSQLTAVYCIGITRDENFIFELNTIAESGIAESQNKAGELIDQWSQSEPEVAAKLKKKEVKTEFSPTENPPSEMDNIFSALTDSKDSSHKDDQTDKESSTQAGNQPDEPQTLMDQVSKLKTKDDWVGFLKNKLFNSKE